VVCRNLTEARRDAEVWEAVLRSLRGGDKALVGNSAYRRYLKTPDEKHFEIDDKRVADDARYDGLYVLRTNTTLSPLAAMLRYRELLKVEDIFRTIKSILDTRPIYHQKEPQSAATSFARSWRSSCASTGRLSRGGAIEVRVGSLAHGPRSPPGNRSRARGQALHPAHTGDRRSRSRPTFGRPTRSRQLSEEGMRHRSFVVLTTRRAAVTY
jgi:hypothetical protein